MQILLGALVCTFVLATPLTIAGFLYIHLRPLPDDVDEHDPYHPAQLGPVVYPIYDVSTEIPGVRVTDNENVIVDNPADPPRLVTLRPSAAPAAAPTLRPSGKYNKPSWEEDPTAINL